jgi:hypothetical protein
MVTIPGVSPIQPDAKAAYLEATPRLEGMAPVVAPEPTVTPDPKSFAQKIEVILPPPPPPPAAKSGGRKSGGGGGGSSSGGGGGGGLNTADAGAFCANISAQRTAHGLPGLSACFATSARQAHANAMAATSPPSIWHQGDNIVGVAPGHTALINAFMASDGHRAQILTPSYTGARVGCAWGQPAGYVPHLYCTADFY